MTIQSVSLWTQILGVVGGAAVLMLFGILLVIPHRTGVNSGSKGHRDENDDGANELIAPDGFIDSFANVIEEAGGGLPLIVQVAIPGILLWWLLYLILNWTGN